MDDYRRQAVLHPRQLNPDLQLGCGPDGLFFQDDLLDNFSVINCPKRIQLYQVVQSDQVPKARYLVQLDPRRLFL